MIFDEQGRLLKLIRMTLVQFIRVTYGSTINRQVRRYIVGLFQEECIVKYLIMLRDAFWSKNPRIERQPRTEEDKNERRQQAKRQLLSNIPGISQKRVTYKKKLLSAAPLGLKCRTHIRHINEEICLLNAISEKGERIVR
jgi:hypothetical protein